MTETKVAGPLSTLVAEPEHGVLPSQYLTVTRSGSEEQVLLNDEPICGSPLNSWITIAHAPAWSDAVVTFAAP